MECKNKTCYLAFMCKHKDRAENCAIHKWFLEGEGVILDFETEFKKLREKKYIPLENCIENHLYKIHSSDSIIGLFRHNKFYISKNLCGFNFIEKENHYDYIIDWGNGVYVNGPIKPYEDLGEVPILKKSDDILKYLNDRVVEISLQQMEKIKNDTSNER